MDFEMLMRAALQEARAALADGEVPIGAVVAAPDGRIIGRGHNMSERLADVTAHAEIQAITAAANTLGGKYLQGCTLAVTVEPCLMCAGAIAWAQIATIVYGCADPKRGYAAYVARPPFHPRAQIAGGVLADECKALMQDFFKGLR